MARAYVCTLSYCMPTGQPGVGGGVEVSGHHTDAPILVCLATGGVRGCRSELAPH